MDSKRILILGGGRYNVPSIQAARNAGFFTVVADRNPEAPGLRIADLPLPIDLNACEALIQMVEEHGGVDGVVSMAEAGVRPAGHISARLGLPSICVEAAANATSKAAMRRLWRSRGEYSIDFEVVTSLPEAEAAVEKLAGFPLIFKPDRSFGGSRGVTRVNSFHEVPQAFQDAKNGGLADSDVVIENCVDGTEHSAEVLIWHGLTSVLCIGQKVKSRPPHRVDVSVQYPAPLTVLQRDTVDQMCECAVNALGLTQGIAHVEFCYTTHGPVLFEVGARCGGGHTPQIAHHVSGVDEFVEACRMACGVSPTQFSPLYSRGAEYRFLVFEQGMVDGIELPDSLLDNAGVLDVGMTVQPGQMIAPLRNTSDRSGFLVTIGRTLEEAATRADEICRQISIRYCDGSVHHAMELATFQEFAHS